MERQADANIGFRLYADSVFGGSQIEVLASVVPGMRVEVGRVTVVEFVAHPQFVTHIEADGGDADRD